MELQFIGFLIAGLIFGYLSISFYVEEKKTRKRREAKEYYREIGRMDKYRKLLKEGRL